MILLSLLKRFMVPQLHALCPLLYIITFSLLIWVLLFLRNSVQMSLYSWNFHQCLCLRTYEPPSCDLRCDFPPGCPLMAIPWCSNNTISQEGLTVLVSNPWRDDIIIKNYKLLSERHGSPQDGGWTKPLSGRLLIGVEWDGCRVGMDIGESFSSKRGFEHCLLHNNSVWLSWYPVEDVKAMGPGFLAPPVDNE